MTDGVPLIRRANNMPGGYKTHKNGHSIQSFKPSQQRGKIYTKLQYRLYADGTIVDQFDNNKQVGWIIKQDEIEFGWRLRGQSQQKYLKMYLSWTTKK